MMEQLLEYFGVLTGLLYLFLEIRQHRAMWVVGFLTSLVYVFVFFFSSCITAWLLDAKAHCIACRALMLGSAAVSSRTAVLILGIIIL